MRLTKVEASVLSLINRSRMTDGWAACSEFVFNQLILPMTDDLVEKDANTLRVRLTYEGSIVVKWLIDEYPPTNSIHN